MTHILHLTASARGSASHSRQISTELVEKWLAAHPGDTVTARDLGHQDLPFVSEPFIYAMYTPPADRTPEQNDLLKLSDEMIAELFAADVIVLGIPMYNFGVPAVFKAYLDQVIRAGVTFNPANYSGLLLGKKVIVVTARGGGGYGPGEARESMNFESNYLKAAFSFIGVQDIDFIHLDNLNREDEVKAASLTAARQRIAEITGA
jgi:FMN-dependent NADH-azoreductase